MVIKDNDNYMFPLSFLSHLQVVTLGYFNIHFKPFHQHLKKISHVFVPQHKLLLASQDGPRCVELGYIAVCLKMLSQN
jgi:hypothetical protein